MQQMQKWAHQLLEWGQMVGLMIIAAATLIAIGHLLHEMVLVMRVTLPDLLLLFIYLEVLAMVSLYLKAGKLPVRIPIYIAIVALARYLILDMKEMDTWRLLGVGGTALLLTLTVFLIRYGHYRFPYQQDE